MRWIAFESSRFFTTGQADRQADKAPEEKKGNSASDKRGGKGQEEGFLENETHNIELLFQWRGRPPKRRLTHCPALPCLACEDGGGRAQDLPWGWVCLEKSVCRHVERMEGRRRRRTETRAVGPALAASHSSPHSIET